MLPALYKYVSAYREKVKSGKIGKATKPLFYLALSLFISIFCYTVLVVPACLNVCDNIQATFTIEVIFIQFNNLSYLLLLAFLFTRLRYVFVGSAHELSACTKRTWWAIFVFTVILSIAAAALYTDDEAGQELRSLLAALAFLFIFIMTLFLNVLFLFKLFKVYRDVEVASSLIDVITRTSLLAFLSLGWSILAALIAVVVPGISANNPSFPGWFTVGIAILVDSQTNFWCTLLSFNYFDTWYYKVCCHLKCKRCCYRCMGGKKQEHDLIQLNLEKTHTAAKSTSTVGVDSSSPASPHSQDALSAEQSAQTAETETV